MDVLQDECLLADDKASAERVSAPDEAQPYPECAMFKQQHTRFQLYTATDQHRAHPPVFYRVGRDEVFRISSQVVLLAASHAELVQLRQKDQELLPSNNELRRSLGAFKCKGGQLSGKRRYTVHPGTYINQFGRAQSTSPALKICF